MHYLGPNQIKPNYIFDYCGSWLFCKANINTLCKKYNYIGEKNFSICRKVGAKSRFFCQNGKQ
jgi:hypothetical protein